MWALVIIKDGGKREWKTFATETLARNNVDIL